MSKSLRQSHGAVITAVGLPASLPRLSRSPGTSWWPQASLAALGKQGPTHHRPSPPATPRALGMLAPAPALALGLMVQGIDGIKLCSLHVLAAHSALAPAEGPGGCEESGMCRAGCEAAAGAGCEDGNGNDAGCERWRGALWGKTLSSACFLGGAAPHRIGGLEGLLGQLGCSVHPPWSHRALTAAGCVPAGTGAKSQGYTRGSENRILCLPIHLWMLDTSKPLLA